ncbi:unnamed protein product [Prorocentrum cordatum]|uniref:Uncharacterized protein n=1 Tax=Prorocentrum cordatum TaxID=2364126 RepID=A0ABN9V2Q0_9DINO|nr:unnamed protein product [Polarella glacialis]
MVATDDVSCKEAEKRSVQKASIHYHHAWSRPCWAPAKCMCRPGLWKEDGGRIRPAWDMPDSFSAPPSSKVLGLSHCSRVVWPARPGWPDAAEAQAPWDVQRTVASA